MIKIFLFIIVYFFTFISFVFADFGFTVDKQKVDINDTLQLSIDLSGDEASNVNVKGLENFDVLSQQRSSSFTSINGNTSLANKISLVIKPKNKGSYDLGPLEVLVGGENKSFGDVKKIEVTGEKLFIGNTGVVNYNKQEKKEENKPTTDNNKETEKYQKQEVQGSSSGKTKEIKDLKGNNMLDIYDIKDNLYFLPINLVYTLFYIVFFIIVYFIYNYYLRNKDKIKKKLTLDSSKIENKQIDFYSKLLKIEKKYINNSNKELFYAKLGDFIRLYLDKKIEAGFHTKTLKELKGNIDNTLFDIIERIYFPEYDGKEDSLENREKIIKDIKEYL